MRILDINDNELLETSVDFELGELKQDKIFKCHHEAIKEIKEQSHYETIKTYANGGKEVKKVIDTPYVAPQEAYDEYEDILRYILFDENEKKEKLLQQELSDIKQWMNDTDYYILKVFRGNWQPDDPRYTEYLKKYEEKYQRKQEIEGSLNNE